MGKGRTFKGMYSIACHRGQLQRVRNEANAESERIDSDCVQNCTYKFCAQSLQRPLDDPGKMQGIPEQENGEGQCTFQNVFWCFLIQFANTVVICVPPHELLHSFSQTIPHTPLVLCRVKPGSALHLQTVRWELQARSIPPMLPAWEESPLQQLFQSEW